MAHTRGRRSASTGITLISFGFLHLAGGLAPPAADRTEDVRERFRDPFALKGLRDLDGRDPRVRRIVLRTAGVVELVDDLAAYAERLPTERPRRIAVGCRGGKHRAVAICEELGRQLRRRGHDVDVQHVHVDLPPVRR